jgi:hypothetical protein
MAVPDEAFADEEERFRLGILIAQAGRIVAANSQARG